MSEQSTAEMWRCEKCGEEGEAAEVRKHIHNEHGSGHYEVLD